MTSQADCHLSRRIANVAAEKATAMARRFVGRCLTNGRRASLRDKIWGLAAREIAPLLPASRQAEFEANEVVEIVGEFLAMGYLADYALEDRAAFDVAAAVDSVRALAARSGLSALLTEKLLARLCHFYHIEKDVVSQGCSDIGLRYVLKSADVVLAQALALAAVRAHPSESDFECLEVLAAGLDVVDDWLDRYEDAGVQLTNPFVQRGSPASKVSSLSPPLRPGVIVRPYRAKLEVRLYGCSMSRHVRAYCVDGIERLRCAGVTDEESIVHG